MDFDLPMDDPWTGHPDYPVADWQAEVANGDTRLSLAAFKRRLKPGDSLKLIAAPEGHRALGTTRKVMAVRSADLIFEGKVYLDFPRASGFACDGRLVRISIGHERDADAHLLYEWLPTAA